MRCALVLARRARTHPNPMVGAVIVKEGKIVGEGWHQGVGTPHAEAAAFTAAGAAARGATVYVTLEPCSHTHNSDGSPRTSCASRCLAAGVSRVVVAMVDPDDRVSGRGIALLREAGVAVSIGLQEKTARALNAAYIKHRTTGYPYITHKAAMTLDGKIAAIGGDSRWITGSRARSWAHRYLRHRADAILVGVGTVLADDPSLTTRLPSGNGHDPLRVIVDSSLNTPLTAQVARPGTLFIAASGKAKEESIKALELTGAEVTELPVGSDGYMDVQTLARLLAERGMYNLLLEGGGELASSFWQAKLIDKAVFFIAPKVIGGRDAKTPVEGAGLSRSMADAVSLDELRIRRFGQDIALEGEVTREPCSPEL
ncbi:MAG: bifunctional diaminohydroxyphosphoribosylaminopyrimidine deaminase/5-amino-6-(5-phosphoribosylamino)uracil reductase RibD [Armatimonadota bacterium]